MATRDDVARRAGVSPSTVSYAMSGRRSISEHTRKKVLAAARELEYAPNAFAAGLAGATKGIIALNYPMRDRGMSPMEVHYFETAIAAARNHGFHLLLWTNPAHDLASLQQFVSQQIVDGVIMMEVEWDDPRVALFQERGVRFVLLGRTGNPGGLPFVDTDFATAARLALEHVVDRGHREVLFVGGAPSEPEAGHGPTVRTAQEMADSARRFGVTLHTWIGTRTYGSGRKAYDFFRAEAPAATAVILFNDPATIAFLHAAQLDGLVIPRDLSMLSIGMGADAAELDPPMSTVVPPVEELTGTAVSMLVDLIEARSEARQVLLPASLIDRGTVRRLG